MCRLQNMEQLHAHDCHQNLTEPQATECHKKVHAHLYNTGTLESNFGLHGRVSSRINGEAQHIYRGLEACPPKKITTVAVCVLHPWLFTELLISLILGGTPPPPPKLDEALYTQDVPQVCDTCI